MEYDYKILEEKFQQLPEHIQEAFTSVEVADEIKEIGTRHGLRVDQEGVLFDLTAYVLLGLIPAGQFTNTLAKEARMDEKDAKAIADDINSGLLAKIRSNAQSIQHAEEVSDAENVESQISNLEQAGGFSVETNYQEISERPGAIEGRGNILDSIEHPQPGSEKIMRKEVSVPQSYTEPLVDQLLQGTVSQPQQKVVQVPEASPRTPVSTPVPQPAPSQPKKEGPDLYRESV